MIGVAQESRHGKYAEQGSERSLSPSSATERFQLAIPKDLLARLRIKADEESTTVSELLRRGAELILSV